ncbi:MAG: hypothetical protein ACTSQS_16520 [Promethearchaeota archaeon]
MIIYVFGEIKSRRKRYVVVEGLINAVNKLKTFKEKNQKIPKMRKKGWVELKEPFIEENGKLME